MVLKLKANSHLNAIINKGEKNYGYIVQNLQNHEIEQQKLKKKYMS